MYLEQIQNEIQNKNPMHQKRVSSFLATLKKEQLEENEMYLQKYFYLMRKRDISLSETVDAYLDMVNSIIVEQIFFLKNKRYRYHTQEETQRAVYHNEEYMPRYMMGVAISQFLWENHYKMFSFFKDMLDGIKKKKNYLEIGVGHGLFFNEALASQKFQYYKAIDISNTSLSMTKEMAEEFCKEELEKVSWQLQDILKAQVEETFDCIVMGEVLEHVEKPDLLLRKISSLLSENGIAYLSTCANAPVIDHIYLYRNIEEIREMFLDCGLEIDKECLISIDHIPEQKWKEERANISYAAIVKKKRE